MKTITAKIADLTAVNNAISAQAYDGDAKAAAKAAKIRKMAAKAGYAPGYGFTDMLKVVLLKEIKFGAIRICDAWYPVVNGEMLPSGHTHTTGALAQTVHYANFHGVAVKV